MYRLFLVDDENGQLELMAEILSEIAPEMEICTYINPLQALDAMHRQPADVVLSDIRMPEMDGLTFASAVRREFPDTVVAMLSAYSDFEYARQAIKLGVSDYLVKPATKKDFQQLIDQIRRQLVNMAQSRDAHTHLADARKQAQFVALRRWLAGEMVSAEVESLVQGAACWVLICWREFNAEASTSGTGCDDLDRALARFICLHMIPESGDEACLTLVGINDAEEIKALLRGLASAACGGSEGIELRLGVSDPTPELVRDRRLVYEQAAELYAITFMARGCCCLTSKAKEIPRISTGAFDGLERAVLSAAIRFAADEAEVLFEEFKLTHGGLKSRSTKQEVESRFSHLYLSLCRQLALEDSGGLSAEIRKLRSFDDMCDTAGRQVSELLRVQRSQLNSGTIGIISDIVQYLESNYECDLSLDSVAERYHFNPSYLSNIFKQYTGVGFKEYLTRIRMEKAKALLRGGNLKVQRIAEMCGYYDNSYFVRLFKKHTGLSPGQYRGKGS